MLLGDSKKKATHLKHLPFIFILLRDGPERELNLLKCNVSSHLLHLINKAGYHFLIEAAVSKCEIILFQSMAQAWKMTW